jgi:hypothetical protein
MTRFDDINADLVRQQLAAAEQRRVEQSVARDLMRKNFGLFLREFEKIEQPKVRVSYIEDGQEPNIIVYIEPNISNGERYILQFSADGDCAINNVQSRGDFDWSTYSFDTVSRSIGLRCATERDAFEFFAPRVAHWKSAAAEPENEARRERERRDNERKRRKSEQRQEISKFVREIIPIALKGLAVVAIAIAVLLFFGFSK